MEEIIFVTKNKGKQASAQQRFDKDKLNIRCYDDEIEEPNVNDVDYIAKTKVIEAYKKINKPCIALDSGFYIEEYPNDPGFPGAFVNRNLLDKMSLEELLNNMKDVSNRNCYFKECLAYYDGKEIKYFYGYTYGKLSYEVRGNKNKKSWSDLWMVFIPKNYDITMGEMSDDEIYNRHDEHTCSLDEFAKWINSKFDNK